jgi:hypothetical protein
MRRSSAMNHAPTLLMLTRLVVVSAKDTDFLPPSSKASTHDVGAKFISPALLNRLNDRYLRRLCAPITWRQV